MSKNNSLKPLFKINELKKIVDKFGEEAEQKVLDILIQAGEYAVKKAREEGKYNDITGNLRSSIGYVIAKNGNIQVKNFRESNNGSDKSTGKTQGYKLARSVVSSSFKNGFVLVVVAGMEYAAAVQDIEGKDVLLGAAIGTDAYLKTLISSIKSKL